MRAILIEEFGGPERLLVSEVPDPRPGDGQVLIEVTAAGVNYADMHRVADDYLDAQSLPFVPGQDVAGRLADGTRVVSIVRGGGYAEQVAAPAALTFPIAPGVSDRQALALAIQGTTAWHLLRTSAQLREGESVAVFAAAGGVGSTAVQLARAWGAGRVIAVASSEEKRRLGLELGADEAVDATAGDLTKALLDANGGRPVDVILEMTGGPVFAQSLAALAPFGRLVHYGTAGREAPSPVQPRELMVESRAVVGFWLRACGPEMLREALDDMWGMVERDELAPLVGASYPMSEVGRAHEDLAARRSIGKLSLDPRS